MFLPPLSRANTAWRLKLFVLAYEQWSCKGVCNYHLHPSAIHIQISEQTPNKVTTFQIKHHSDDIKTHVFRKSDVRSFRMPFDLTQLDDDSSCLFQLMSGEAAKECVTIAYTRVQSTSKLLANKLPKKNFKSSTVVTT